MSHLWFENADGNYLAQQLEAEFVQLATGGQKRLVAIEQLHGVSGPVLVRTRNARGLEDWALLSPADSRTRINGLRVPIGIHMLRDRDAIALGQGQTVFFSSERVAQVAPFPGEDDHTRCIRCNLPLEPGEPAVRCPAPECGFWHHQSEDKPCWNYRDVCANCGRPMAFDAGYQWIPSEL